MISGTLLYVVAALAGIILIYSFRVLAGPTVFDRMLGLNGISTKAIILLVLIGTIYERLDMFVDIAVGYAILNLVGALAAAKYLEEKGD
ncbi:MAG TPA: monovalent cation/H+ antiporter complex subunit F [Nitrospiria bacterium]|nr:monovalent cation/H+ antiporter complex subunit F [Nitrospiria bacterium]